MLAVDIARAQGAFRLDVTFQVAAAGITVLFGPSGSGKTSTIAAIAGHQRPDRGRVVLGERVLVDRAAGIDVPAWRRRIGVVFQDARLFPHLTVRANLLYGWRRAPQRASPAEIDRVIGLLDLRAHLSRRVWGLSGGERQRVALGRALLSGPDLLLMDEPLAALDLPRKAEILGHIERLRDETAVPILYVTHAIDELTRLADQVVVLDAGRVAAAGPLQAIMNRTDLRPLTGRFEAGSVLEGPVVGHDPTYALTDLDVGGQALRMPGLEVPVGTRLRVRIRARDVSLALQPPVGLSIRNALRGRVVDIDREEGAHAEVTVALQARAGDPAGPVLRARVTRLAVDSLGLGPGSIVFALVKSTTIDRRLLRTADDRSSG